MEFDFSVLPIKDRFIYKRDEKKEGNITITTIQPIQIVDTKKESLIALLFDQPDIEYARTICYALNCFHGRE
jgi:hypothetical protein